MKSDRQIQLIIRAIVINNINTEAINTHEFGRNGISTFKCVSSVIMLVAGVLIENHDPLNRFFLLFATVVVDRDIL